MLRRFKKLNSKIIPILVCSVLFLHYVEELAFSLPQVEEVISGSAEISQPNSTTLQITADNNTIINYSSFNIQENESVIINLPSADSQLLNKVLGSSASQLLGNLTSNGLFILVNPSGIYIGSKATIDAASIIMSTRDISNTDFLNGNYVFQKLTPEQLDKLLVNEGNITIQKGGFGVLIAGGIENKGKIIAPTGTVALATGDAVRLDIAKGGLISVAIEKETASSVVDSEGNAVSDQIKNTGTLEANGGTVILDADSVSGIFKQAINLQGYVTANKVESKDGVIRIVADQDVRVNATVRATNIEVGDPSNKVPENVEIAGGSLEAEKNIIILAKNNITTNSNLTTSDGDIKILADQDNNARGSFTQSAGTIYAQKTGNVYIDASETMSLLKIKTDDGFIKIGSQRTPKEITGSPYYIHTKGHIEINSKSESNNIATLGTSRGDTLKYNTQGSLTLEASAGKVVDLTDSVLKANTLKLTGQELSVNTNASNFEIYKTLNDFIISKSSTLNGFITLEGDDVKLTYPTTSNITLKSDGPIRTTGGATISGQKVTLIANKFGDYIEPISLLANEIILNRLSGIIEILDSTSVNNNILIRGPPANSFGAIIYNNNASLTLQASQVTFATSAPSYIYGNVTFYNFIVNIPDKELYFEAGKTYTFKDRLEIIGSPDQGAEEYYIKMRSQTPGSQWIFDRQTDNYTLDRINISDAFATHFISIPIGINGGGLNDYTNMWYIDPVWDGGGSTNNWSDATNWDGNAVPTTTQAVTFNSTSTKNVTIDSLGTWSGGNIIIGGTVSGVYSGTITVTATNMTVGTFTMEAGTTATFVAPSGTLTVNNTFNIGAGTFTHNSGTVKFVSDSSSYTITSNAITFNNVTFDKSSGATTTITLADSFTVAGTITGQNSSSNTLNVVGSNTPTITASGSISFPSTSQTGPISFGGATTAQFTVNLAVDFTQSDSNVTFKANLTFNGTGAQSITHSAGTINTGTWTMDKSAGTLTLSSDLSILDLTITAGTFSSGSNNITLTGKYTQSGGTFTAPSATLTVSNTFNITGGTFTHNSGTVKFSSNGASYTITSNAITFNNVTFDKSSGATTTITLADSFTVAGTITGQNTDDSTLNVVASNTPTITASGSISFPSTSETGAIVFGGATTTQFTVNLAVDFTLSDSGVTFKANLTFNGSGAQALSASTGTINTGTWTMDKSGGTLTLNSALTIGDLTITTGTFSSGANNISIAKYTQSGGTFTAPSGTLTVTNTFNISGGTFTHNSGTVKFSSNGGSYTITSNAITFNNVTFDKSSGASTTITLADSFTVAGTITGQNTDDSLLTVQGSGTPTITVSGSISFPSTTEAGTITVGSTTASSNFTVNLAVDFTQSDSNVTFRANLTFNGTGAQAITHSAGTIATGTWTVNKSSGTASLASNTTIGGGLTLTAGTLDIAGYNITVTGTFSNNATVALQGGETITLTMDTNSGTVKYNATSGSRDIKNIGATDYWNLTIDGNGGTFTLGAALVVDNNFTLTNGTFDASDQTVTINGNTTISGGTYMTGTAVNTFGNAITDTVTIEGGTLEIESDVTNTDIAGSAVVSVTGGTISYKAGTTVSTKILSIFSPYNHLVVNSMGSTYTLNGNITVNGNFTITAGTVDVDSTSVYSIAVKGNWSNSDTFTPRSGTVTFSGTAAQTVNSGGTSAGKVFNNIRNSNTSAAVSLLTNAVQIDGTLTIDSSATFDLAGLSLTLGTLDNSGTLRLQGGETVSITTMDTNSGTVTYNGTGTYTAASGGLKAGDSYYNLTFNGSGGSWELDANLAVSNVLTITAGTLDASSRTITLSGNGTPFSNSGTFTASTSTVTYTGSGVASTITIAAVTYNNLTLNNSAKTFALAADTTVSNNLTITAGTLDVVSGSNFALNVGGSYSNSGTFTARSGTVTLNATATGKTITSGGSSFYNLTLNGVGGGWTLQDNTTVSNVLTITNGTLDASSRTLTLSGNGTPFSNSGTFTASTSTVSYTGNNLLGNTTVAAVTYYNLTVNNASETYALGGDTTVSNVLTISAGILDASSKTLTLSGNGTPFSNSGTFTASTSTVSYTGNNLLGNTTIAAVTYKNLTLNNSLETYVLAADTTVSGNLTITAGTLDVVNGSNFSLNVGGNWSNSGTFTARSGTVTFNGTADQTITTNAQAFYNLTLNNTGASGSDDVIISGALDVDNVLTITDGNLDIDTNDPNVTLAGNLSIASAGSVTKGSGTWTFDGSGTSTWSDSSSAIQDLGAVTINGSSKTISTSTNVKAASITIGADDIFNISGDTLTLTGTGTVLTLNSGGTFTTTSSTVVYTGTTTATTIGAVNYNNLTLTPTAATTFNLGGNLTGGNAIVGTLTINANATLDATSNNYNLTAAAITIAASGTYTARASTITVSGNFSNSGTFTAGTSTVTFDKGSGTQTLNSGSSAFYNLTHSGAGTLQLATNALTVAGTLTNSAGTFDANGLAVTVTGLATVSGGTYLASTATQTFDGGLTISGGTFTGSSGTVDVNGDLTLSSGTLTAPSGTFTVGGSWTKTGGTFTLGTGTVTFDATSTGKTITSGSGSFYNLTFNGTGGEWTLQDALDVDSNFTLTAGTVLANGKNITVARNWSNLGTFTHGNNTVTFDGTGISTISGDTTFYKLTSITAGKQLTFAASSTQITMNTLTLTGSAGNLIKLRSSADGTQWKINPQGTRNISFVDVKDSNNINSTVIDPTSSTDSGNTIGWFPAVITTPTTTTTTSTTTLKTTSNEDITKATRGVDRVIVEIKAMFNLQSISGSFFNTIIQQVKVDAPQGMHEAKTTEIKSLQTKVESSKEVSEGSKTSQDQTSDSSSDSEEDKKKEKSE